MQDGPWASHDFTSLAGAGLHEQMVAAFEQFYHPGGLPECRHEAVAVAVAEAEVGADTAQKKAVAFSEVLSDEHTALDSRRQHGLALPRARLHSVEAGVAAGLLPPAHCSSSHVASGPESRAACRSHREGEGIYTAVQQRTAGAHRELQEAGHES